MKLTKVLFLSALGFCVSEGAYAGSVGSVLDVSARVIPACFVSTTALDFGDYDTVSGITATGQIDVTCTEGTPYHMALDGGIHFTTRRRMSSEFTGEFLEYDLFSDPATSKPWGDSDYDATTPWPSVADVGTGSLQSHTVYGDLPGAQAVSLSDDYRDAVAVTIHY